MKLKHIAEAKYYRQHSVEDVHSQYTKIIDQQRTDPQRLTTSVRNNVGLAGTQKTHDKAFATVYAYDVKNEQQFRDAIERFMRENEAPYDQLLDIEDKTDDDDNYSFFQGVVVYREKQ